MLFPGKQKVRDSKHTGSRIKAHHKRDNDVQRRILSVGPGQVCNEQSKDSERVYQTTLDDDDRDG